MESSGVMVTPSSAHEANTPCFVLAAAFRVFCLFGHGSSLVITLIVLTATFLVFVNSASVLTASASTLASLRSSILLVTAR